MEQKDLCLTRHDKSNKYVGLPYCRVEMYAGRVACCLRWGTVTTGQTDGRTDVRQMVTLRFPLEAVSITRPPDRC